VITCDLWEHNVPAFCNYGMLCFRLSLLIIYALACLMVVGCDWENRTLSIVVCRHLCTLKAETGSGL